MHFSGILVLCGCAAAQGYEVNLGPQDTWEAASDVLSQIETKIADQVQHFQKIMTTKEHDKASKATATPWTWHDLDADFEQALKDVKPGRALDIGCGKGTQSISLAKHGWNVIGVDQYASVVEHAIAEAQRQGLSSSCTFHEGNFLQPSSLLSQPGFGRNSFDLIIDRGYLHGVHKMEQQLVEAVYFFCVKYLLKPGGRLLVKTMHPAVFGRVGAGVARNLKLNRYHASPEYVQPLMMVSKFWLLPSGHFRPNPSPFTGEQLEALVSKHMDVLDVNGEALIQTEANSSVMFGFQLPADSSFVAAMKPASGDIRIAAMPMADPMSGFLHIKNVLSVRQFEMYQEFMQRMKAAQNKSEL